MLLAMPVTACSSLRQAARAESPTDEAARAMTVVKVDEMLTIFGPTEVSPERMWAFVAAVNPDFSLDIARAYYEIGRRYGIRGDVALCQSILETGWFRFTGGTAVRPEQHNYCGLGVTRLGVRGHKFRNIEEGVTAHLQHLYAYASRHSLPEGEKMVDPRFKLVKRGVATSWTDLNNRWAANRRYGQDILAIFQRLMADNPPRPEEPADSTSILELGIPDHLIPE